MTIFLIDYVSMMTMISRDSGRDSSRAQGFLVTKKTRFELASRFSIEINERDVATGRERAAGVWLCGDGRRCDG